MQTATELLYIWENRIANEDLTHLSKSGKWITLLNETVGCAVRLDERTVLVSDSRGAETPEFPSFQLIIDGEATYYESEPDNCDLYNGLLNVVDTIPDRADTLDAIVDIDQV